MFVSVHHSGLDGDEQVILEQLLPSCETSSSHLHNQPWTMAKARQLRLLLWKNFTLRKREPIRIIIELIWPLFLFLILAIVKLDRGLQDFIPECHFDGKSMPSAGPLPFMQSMFCTMNNTCHQNIRPDEMPGQVNTFNKSLVSQFYYDIEELLSNQTEVGALERLVTDLQALQDLAKNPPGNCTLQLGDLLVDRETLLSAIQAQNLSLTPEAIQELFNATINLSMAINMTEVQSWMLELYNLTIGDPGGIAAAHHVRNKVCSQNPADELLFVYNLTSPATRDLVRQLCNLTDLQFEELLIDIRDDLDREKLMKQLQECANLELQYLSREQIQSTLNILGDLRELDSLEQLLASMNSTYSSTMSDLRGNMANASRANMTSMLSQVLCGRPGIMGISSEESDLNNAFGDSKEDNKTAGDKDKSRTPYLYDNTTTKFCNDLFNSTQQSAQLRILWRQVKPIIRGKIPFTPNNPAVRAVIKEASQLFNSLKDLQQIAQDWLDLTPNITQFMESSSIMNEARKILDELATLEDSPDALQTYLQEYIQGRGQRMLEGSNVPSWLRAMGPLLAGALPQVGSVGSLGDLLQQRGVILPSWFPTGPAANLSQIWNQFPKYRLDQYSRWLSLSDDDNYNWRDSLNSTSEIMTQIKNYLECFEFDKFIGFDTEEELIKEGLILTEQEKLWAALVFENVAPDAEALPTMVAYKIRMDTDRVDTTAKAKVLDKFWTPGARARPLPDMKYLVYGFAYIQDMVSHAIIRLLTNETETANVGINVQQFPYPCYIFDKLTRFLAGSIPLFMILSWIFSVAMVVKGVVYEKEQRLKEVMKVMGLGNGVHWLAWFITCSIMMTVSVCLLVMVLKVGLITEHSDWTVLLVFMLVFMVATITQCFLFSVFFSKANMAAACAGLFYYIGYLPYSFCVQWEEYMTQAQKFTASLSSEVAFGFGCSYIARYESQGVGIQWSNVMSSPIPEDGFSMGHAMIIMLVDAVIYMLLTLYIETVFPGQYGVPKKWYYFLTRSYWCGTMYDSLRQNSYDAGVEMDNGHDADYEKEPSHLKLGVAIKKMKKVYSRGNKTAVDGLNLNFYEGQITSFLGHNGAGKTTTMSILTGLFPPTEGTAFIYNQDIRTEMDSIRHNMGMCPQHNVLFDKLTVEEHLWFYASLKGVSSAEVEREVLKMTKDVGLPHKRKELCSKLSGGMKRKLSVAIAFVGGSKVVILDEPTAGVDPYARRSIWELLLRYRAGRTIILSTHFMDEADILGDRVAIISQGRLCCCGTSLFLKSRFGSGYYLTLVKADEEAEDTDKNGLDYASQQEKPTIEKLLDSGMSISKDEGIADLSVAGSSSVAGSGDADQLSEASSTATVAAGNAIVGPCREQQVTAFIQMLVPEAVLKENMGTELTYQLPDDSQHRAAYEHLFAELDANLLSLGLLSYGISDTSLEEVFLRVAEETGVDDEITDETRRQNVESLTDSGAVARPVTRLSFRKNKKHGFFGLGRKKPIDERVLVGDASSEVDSSLPLLAHTHYSSTSGSVLDADLSDTDTSALGVSVEATQNCNGAGAYTVTGAALIRRQFWALLVKRFHHLRRNKKGFIVQIVLPAIFICLAMIFAMINPPTPSQPPLELHPWLLAPLKMEDKHLYMFYSNDEPDSPQTRRYEELLTERPGVGARCVNPDLHTIEGFKCDEQTNSAWKMVKGNVSAVKECSCETGYQRCPEDAAGPEPSRLLLPSTDYLYNMTGRNITQWLTRSMEQYMKKRYGGLSFGERNPLVEVNATQLKDVVDRLLVAANGGAQHPYMLNPPPMLIDIENLLDTMVTRQNAKVWFNNKGYVSMVSYMNIMNNLILRANMPPGADPMNYGIIVSNHPMNRTKSQLTRYTLRAGFVDLLISISVIFAMSNVPASFVVFLIEERATNSKHLQFVSGVNPVVYWVANFCWDMMNYAVSALLCIIIFLAFQQRAYVSGINAPCLISLLFLYGWAVTPMMYPASRWFSVSSTAYVALACTNVVLGFVSTISTFVLESLQEQDLDDINSILMKVFLLLPHYCLGRGLIDMTRNQLMADAFSILGEDVFKNPFTWTLVGRNLFSLVILGFGFFILNLLIEYGFFINKLPCLRQRKKTRPPDNVTDEDVDVARERRRVMAGGAKDDVLTIEELTKIYTKKLNRGRQTAVDNLCIGVHHGECFGLLGVNGAGKTTTFKMLTGDTTVTSGNAHLAGHSILSQMQSVHQQLGYCPQFDALCPLLTGLEHLELYARLRGVPEADIPVVAAWGIRKLGLARYANKCAGDYSGGNKRKLSTAIALVGNPPVMFLDEPTTGMDPKARRFLWSCINNITRDGRSVVLTSHSMEECEALCTRMAIMVNGVFKCLGSVQHLKSRFGDGYTIIVRVAGADPDLTPVKEFMARQFEGIQLREQHHNQLQYQLGAGRAPLSAVFGQMEASRKALNLEDYSVSQTTLDQVFINFARLQTDLLDDEIIANSDITTDPALYPEGNSHIINNDTDRQIHGIENVMYDIHEDASLHGSQITLVQRPSSGRSDPSQQLPNLTNC